MNAKMETSDFMGDVNVHVRDVKIEVASSVVEKGSNELDDDPGRMSTKMETSELMGDVNVHVGDVEMEVASTVPKEENNEFDDNPLGMLSEVAM
jgi:hypothetical protein